MRRIPVMLVVSLLALCLTATAAFAAHSPNSPVKPNIADPSAIVVPDEPAPSASDADENEAEESEAPDSSEGAESGDPTAHPSNHGLTVSEAAQATTPPGCKNHGQYVSLVARGVVDPNDPDATPLPEGASVCDAANTGGKATEHGKPTPKPKH